MISHYDMNVIIDTFGFFAFVPILFVLGQVSTFLLV
jgi:hypothetical protein